MGVNSLIYALVVLIIFGLIWWLVETYILPKVADPFNTIIRVGLVIVVILWLLSLIGFGPGFGLMRR